jgi:DNA-binding winged helix-turn-helix (wHTH) protein
MASLRLAFGDCEFDSGRRLLLRHGRVEPLSPRAFQLLEVLLDRRPEAVTKAELLGHLWPDTFVSDASLHNLVAEVRGALGDDPRTARYIRTVSRYGYAFHGDARPASAADIPGSAAPGPRLISGSREWPLAVGSTIVGRDRGCAVRIDSGTISRRHARIVVTGDVTTVEDLGSKNGTQVNGKAVTSPVILKDNDVIQAGSIMMTYRIMDVLPSTITRRL